MAKRANSTAKGVDDAFSFWLNDHPISVPEIIQEAIEKAFKRWLDENTEEITEAIAKRWRP